MSKTITVGDSVWFWYYDDGTYNVWYGDVKAEGPYGSVIISYLSYIDLEANEKEPYEVEFTVAPFQIFETRGEAVSDAAAQVRKEIDQAVEDDLKQNNEAKLQWEERTRRRFPYKEGDELYVVIPYAAGAAVELKHGTVSKEPRSKQPKWFCLKLDEGPEEMVPVAFCADTPEEAARLYADSIYRQLMDTHNKEDVYEGE